MIRSLIPSDTWEHAVGTKEVPGVELAKGEASHRSG
jgi:hypothetical protein